MENLFNNNITFDLFKNLIILNKSNKIVFLGDEINTILLEAGIDIKKAVQNNYSCEEGKFLQKKITLLRNKKLFSEIIQFSNLKTEFVLLPTDFDKFEDIVLAVKEEIEQICSIKSKLEERVKELECLYKISGELENLSKFDNAINNCVKHIRNGMQYPDITKVCINLDAKKFGDIISKNKTYKILKGNITKNKKIRGNVVIAYSKERPFLDEEKTLINEIAGKISIAVEKREEKNDLEKRKKILTEKNKTLIRLTNECKESREKLHAFFNAIEDIIIVIDKDFNITMSNDTNIGNSGKCYEKLFYGDKICENCPAFQTFETSKPAKNELLHSKKSFHINSYPIFGEDDNVEGVLEVCHDITAYKKMERGLIQSNKLASLGKLVAGVAHEINNPNTFILGNIKIISEALNDILPILDDYHYKNKQLKIARLDYNIFKEHVPILLQDMEGGSIRMKKIVEDLRNFARRDEHTLTENVDINEVLQNTIRLIKKQVTKKAKLKIDLTENIPYIIGNISKLEQVFVNMIINASHSIEKRNGLIEINTNFIEETNKIEIIIKDNGKGIDEKTITNIFDPFFTTKSDTGGTGLGLSISYGIIKDHKGSIRVNSTLGKGTTFIISIPKNMKI